MIRVRVGVTGLSRAGKTVFLTSTLYNLLETTGSHLPLFKAKSVKFAGTEHALGGSQRLPLRLRMAHAAVSAQQAVTEGALDVAELVAVVNANHVPLLHSWLGLPLLAPVEAAQGLRPWSAR